MQTWFSMGAQIRTFIQRVKRFQQDVFVFHSLIYLYLSFFDFIYLIGQYILYYKFTQEKLDVCDMLTLMISKINK